MLTEMTRFATGAIVRACESLCEACGQPAEVKTENHGIGSYEYWGTMYVDNQWVEVTDCCASSLAENSIANKRLFKWYPPRKGDVK